MQEVIKDETGSRKFKRDVRRMAGLGLVFGLVACVTFCAFGPWIESRFGGAKEEVEIPRDEETLPEEETREQDPEEDSYRQIAQLSEIHFRTGGQKCCLHRGGLRPGRGQ